MAWRIDYRLFHAILYHLDITITCLHKSLILYCFFCEMRPSTDSFTKWTKLCRRGTLNTLILHFFKGYKSDVEMIRRMTGNHRDVWTWTTLCSLGLPFQSVSLWKHHTQRKSQLQKYWHPEGCPW